MSDPLVASESAGETERRSATAWKTLEVDARATHRMKDCFGQLSQLGASVASIFETVFSLRRRRRHFDSTKQLRRTSTMVDAPEIG